MKLSVQRYYKIFPLNQLIPELKCCAIGIITFLSSIVSCQVFCQSVGRTIKTTIIEPYRLSITQNKTTNLIFPYAIKSVDRGSREVLAEKAKGVENILMVKAARENLKETNLTVITSDGELHSFLINYMSNPPLLNISFSREDTVEELKPLLPSGSNEAALKITSVKLSKRQKTIYGVNDSKYQVQLRLNGLYIEKDKIYYQIEVKNRSNINYDIEKIRFFIKDKKKIKRTASQEIELDPLYVHGDTTVVHAGLTNILVFALAKFTIPDKKYLLVQLMEENGGRHLQLKVHNRTIINAQPVSK